MSRPPTAMRRRTGIGLVELLISLALCASLLAAVAVATHASFDGYAVNVEHTSLMQGTRVALHRILTHVRTSDAHLVDPDANSAANQAFTDGDDVEGATSIALYAEDGTMYHYHLVGDELRVEEREAGATTSRFHRLLGGVKVFRVTLQPMRSKESIRTGGKHDQLKRATIVLTVGASADEGTDEAGDGGQQATVTLSSSAVPRRNVW